MATTHAPIHPEASVSSGAWELDRTHSRLAFAVNSAWGLSTVYGHFKAFNGALTVSPDGVSGVLEIDAASLETGNDSRDEHLRTADFFSSEQHPLITFSVHEISHRAGGVTIAGDLVVRRTTVPLRLAVDVDVAEDGSLLLHTSTRLPRDQVGMTWNKLGIIRGDALLSADVHLVRALSS